jgi:PBP1b-binding outer membrane lipoprotein LpoB
MNKTEFYVLMATCVLLLASCSGLNESAQNVKYSTKSEAPKDCKEIGEVSVGSFLPHMTMESVKNEMRNKTSAMGGNFLVIDEIKSVSSSTPPTVGANGLMMGGGSSSSGYTGSGRAYQCPQS